MNTLLHHVETAVHAGVWKAGKAGNVSGSVGQGHLQ